MTQDFTSSTPGELSVSRGQQVEILEQRSNGPTSDNMVLVRVSPPTTAAAAAVPANSAEGLVPVSCIRLPPVTSRSRRADTIGGEAGNGKQLCQMAFALDHLQPYPNHYPKKADKGTNKLREWDSEGWRIRKFCGLHKWKPPCPSNSESHEL